MMGELYVYDVESNTWKCSVCGLRWTLNDGTPKENGMKYCPKCGNRIRSEV